MRIAISEFKYPFYCQHGYTHLRCQQGAERRGIWFWKLILFILFFFERKSALKHFLLLVHFLTGEQFLWFIYFYYCLTSKIGRRICRNFRGWKFIFQSSSVWKSVTKRKILQNFRWKMKNATLFFHWYPYHTARVKLRTFAPREPLFWARIAFWRI